MTDDGEPHYRFIGAVAFGVMLWAVVVLRGASIASVDTQHLKPVDVSADTIAAWTAPIN